MWGKQSLLALSLGFQLWHPSHDDCMADVVVNFDKQRLQVRERTQGYSFRYVHLGLQALAKAAVDIISNESVN